MRWPTGGVEDHQVLDHPGEPAVVTGEGDAGHGRTVLGAVDPPGVTDQLAGGEPDVDVTPSPGARSEVEPRRRHATASTASTTSAGPSSRPDRDHQRRTSAALASQQFEATQDHRMAQSKQRDQYALGAHALLSLPLQL